MMLGSRSPQSATAGSWPVLESQANTTLTSPATSHVMTMPSGIVAGDFLLCFCATGANYTRTPSAGWSTELTLSSAAGYAQGSIFYKVASGSDTLTITTSSATSLVGSVLRLTNANTIDSAHVNDYYAVNPNPPLLTPSISGKKYLYFAGAVSAGLTQASSAPTNYTGLVNLPGVDGNACTLFYARRSGLEEAEDPGAFIGGASYHDVFTVAVYSTA